MSDAGSVSSSAGVETKTRITRSSIGQVSTGASATDLIKQEDTTDRARSPANSRSSLTKSRTSTPTQEPPSNPDQSLSSAESTPVSTVLAKKRMGMGITAAPVANTRRSTRSNKLNTDEESDTYCWICRKDTYVIPCQLCPRVYHAKCLGLTGGVREDWTCIECEKVMRSECEDTKPKALASLSMEQLITCLQYALERMKVPNSEVFQVPVDPAMEPEYHNIIIHPMDMSTLDKNIKKKVYGSTEAFLADAKWILHNSILYNGMHNKYTMTAKSVLKICRNQMMEIETCPDCFLASCTQENNWFCKPCRFSHPLVWAKLKGYPFWPAKALREVDGQVDCRFFGAHDKAWVPANQVFMLSSEPPAPVNKKKGSGFDEAMVELDKYVVRFKAKYGTFNYATVKEPYRADFGVSSSAESESRKRKLATNSEESDSKKPATETPEDPASETNGTAAATTEVKKEASAIVSTVCEPAKEEKPVISKPVVIKEPPKPGVFTMNDESMVGTSSTEFSVMTDDHVTSPPANALVRKIEETVSQTEGDRTEKVQQPQTSSTTSEAVKDSADVLSTEKTVESMDTSLPDTSHTADEPVPEMKLTDEAYTAKLKQTIDTVKDKVPDEEEKGEEEEEADSDSSSSDSEYEEFVRRRRYSKYKQAVALDSLSEKEAAVAMQLVKLMKDGLESTIKDVVKQTLTGQINIQTSSSTTSAPESEMKEQSSPEKKTTDSSTNSPLVNGVTPSPAKTSSDIDKPAQTMTVSPAKAEPGTKSEPLSESGSNQENSELVSSDSPVSSELVEKLTWKHKCEIEAVKHNAELAAMEMRKSIELEKERALWRLRKQLEHKFKKIIEETKKKQWCAMCGKEAIFYCCWNTSYCDYPCQQKHWPSHLKTCAQISKEDGGDKKQSSSGSSQPPSSQSNNERAPQAAHSNSAPPPYTSSSSEIQAPQYLMPGQVQYMPVQTNAAPVYQAQLPLQAMPMQAGPRGPGQGGAPMLYPVMPPPSQQGPPQPQSYMLSQRQPYRLAPKY